MMDMDLTRVLIRAVWRHKDPEIKNLIFHPDSNSWSSYSEAKCFTTQLPRLYLEIYILCVSNEVLERKLGPSENPHFPYYTKKIQIFQIVISRMFSKWAFVL